MEPDGIFNKAIKHLPQEEAVSLFNIINATLPKAYFPPILKKAIIIIAAKNQCTEQIFAELQTYQSPTLSQRSEV